MRSSSSPPSRDQLWSLSPVACSPDHAVSGHWSLNLTDPGSAFRVFREPLSRTRGNLTPPNPRCKPPRVPSFPRPQDHDHIPGLSPLLKGDRHAGRLRPLTRALASQSHASRDPMQPGVGPYIPRSTFSSPSRVVLTYNLALIPEGVSFSRTPFPTPLGVCLFISVHWGPVTSTSSALHCPVSLSQLPPGSVSVFQIRPVLQPRFLLSCSLKHPHSRDATLGPGQLHLSPSAEDGGAGTRPQQRPQIQRLSSKPTAASAGLL